MSWLWHFLRAEYWGHPWYNGAVWGNLFVVPLAFVLGVLVWPWLRHATHRFIDRKLEGVHGRFEELHARFDSLEERLEKKP